MISIHMKIHTTGAVKDEDDVTRFRVGYDVRLGGSGQVDLINRLAVCVLLVLGRHGLLHEGLIGVYIRGDGVDVVSFAAARSIGAFLTVLLPGKYVMNGPTP